MTIVFLQSLKNQRTTILVLCLALIVFEALIAATFNSLYEGLPDIARDLLRAGGGSPTAYQAAIGFRHPMFLVVVVGFVIAGLVRSCMAREIERGTAFILLARPIERYKVVLVRVATMVIVLLLMLLAAFVGVALGAQVFGLPELDYGLLALGQVNALFLLTAVAGYSLFVSSLSNDGGQGNLDCRGACRRLFLRRLLGQHVGGGGSHRQALPIPLLRPRHRRLGGDARPAQHRGSGRRHGRRVGRRAGGVPAPRHHAVGARWPPCREGAPATHHRKMRLFSSRRSGGWGLSISTPVRTVVDFISIRPLFLWGSESHTKLPCTDTTRISDPSGFRAIAHRF